jgi:hypothetical protein
MGWTAIIARTWANSLGCSFMPTIDAFAPRHRLRGAVALSDRVAR